jgi:hypothetical protein
VVAGRKPPARRAGQPSLPRRRDAHVDAAAVVELHARLRAVHGTDLDVAEPSVPRDDHGLDDAAIELGTTRAQRELGVPRSFDVDAERSQGADEAVGRRDDPPPRRVGVRRLHAERARQLEERSREALAHPASSNSSRIPRTGVATQSGRLSIS